MSTKIIKEVLTSTKADRRVLPHVPDPYGIRGTNDRRNLFALNKQVLHSKEPGKRYLASFPVKLRGRLGGQTLQSVNISQSGILLRASSREAYEQLDQNEQVRLFFKVPAGAMEEGMEGKRVSIKATKRRSVPEENSVAFEFEHALSSYYKSRETVYSAISFAMLLMLSGVVLLMRAEIICYFLFNRITAVYSVITGLFLLTRYLFGSFYRPVAVDQAYTPGVSIIIPCYNEEEWIDRTITCALDQDYPPEKLEVIIVDDASTDKSLLAIQQTLDRLFKEGKQFAVHERVKLLKQQKNAGKRHAMAWGVKEARHDLVVFVDSDSFLEPDAIINLVQPFKDEKIAGVSGRTDVANTFTNHLTRMQSVRYYVAFRVMKAAESLFDSVTCLSGPLSCYRKSVMMEHLDDWLNQSFLGQKATFGDDRSMTNFMLRNHRTSYQHTAVVPVLFTAGILLMPMMTSVAPLFLRRSTTWLHGILFNLFYVVVLIWQMPIAWFTFWRSNWGTR